MKMHSSFLRRLREDPVFREEVRRLVLTDELLDLPRRVDALRAEMLEEFRRVWEALRHLTERVDGLAQQVDALARQVNGLTQRVDALAQRVDALRAEMLEEFRRVWEALRHLTERVDGLAQQVQALAEAQKQTQREVGRLANIVGATVEEEAGDVAWGVFRHQGWELLEGPWAVELDGDIDVVLRVRREDRPTLYVLVEAKLRLHERDVRRWSEKLGDPAFRERLRAEGIGGPAVPYVYGVRVYKGVAEAGAELGIGVLGPEGELVAPRTLLEI